MTWSKTINVGFDDTFADAVERIDVSTLDVEYQHQLKVAVDAAGRLVANGEQPSTEDGSCRLVLSGYIAEGHRHISVSVLDFADPRPKTPGQPSADTIAGTPCS